MDSTATPPPTKKPLKNPCNLCQSVRAILKRPKTGQQLCKECFFHVFETEIHNTITDNKLFSRGNRVAIGASGGKGNSFTTLGNQVVISNQLGVDFESAFFLVAERAAINLFFFCLPHGVSCAWDACALDLSRCLENKTYF